MFNLRTLSLTFLLTLSFFACKDKNEDVTTEVNKSGAVETAVQVVPLDSFSQELITKHKVWVKNNVFKTIEYRDTIPALEYENSEVADKEGNTQNVRVQKDYEIYITVK